MREATTLKLLFAIILMLAFVSSASAGVFCIEPREDLLNEYYCAYFEDPDEANDVCLATAQEAEQCSRDYLGCCCDEGGSITYERLCSEDFNPSIKDVNICQEDCLNRGADDTPAGNCEGFNFANVNLRAEHVKGSPSVQLRWSSCDASTIEIKRDTTLLASLGSQATSYRDTTSAWSNTYTYTITVTYSGASYTSTAYITTGSPECDGITHYDLFCVRVSEGGLDTANSYGICSASNTYNPSGSCEEGETCVIENGLATCKEASMCENINLFLGWSTIEDCREAGYCYYDRTNLGIDRCFECSPSMSCFDYKTSTACSSDMCNLNTECQWHPFNDELGTGICKSDAENYCPLRTTPQGYFNTDSYTPLLTPTTLTGAATMRDFFSTASYTCSDSACLQALSCMNFDGNSHQCLNNECRPPRIGDFGGCDYVNANNKCTRRSIHDTSHPCEDRSGEDRIKCERDYFAPQTSIIATNLTTNYRFTLTITDQTSSNTVPSIVESPYTKGYATSLCIALTQNADCTTARKNHNIQSPTFHLDHLLTLFPELEKGKTYFLVVNSSDPYSNKELDSSREMFSIPEVIESPPPPTSAYNFSLDSPSGLAFRANEPFNILVSTNKQSTSCVHAIANSLDAKPGDSSYMALSRMNEIGTAFARWSFERVDPFALFINCTSTNNEKVHRSFWIESVSQDVKLAIKSVNFNPTILTQKLQEGWKSNLVIETNMPSRCRYSWTSDTPYGSKLSYDEQDKDSSRYVYQHNIPILITDTINSPQNRTAYVMCQSPFPNDDPRFTPERNATLMIYPNAPGSLWINIVSPLPNTTSPPTYYTNYSVPYHITTELPSTCSATISGDNMGLQSGVRTNWTGTVTVGESGSYRMYVNCRYEVEGNQRDGTTDRRFYVDATAPYVYARIGPNDTAATTNQAGGFNFTTTYNDSHTGVANARYTVIRKNTTSYEAIVSTGTLPIQNVYELGRTVQGPLWDMHAYRINVTVTDAAGNLMSRESNEILVKLPNMCEDGYHNGDETDQDCGGPDCPGCSAGLKCNINSDCLSGLLCLEGNDGKVCAPAHCNDGIRNSGEEDIDCGPVCFKDCQEHIRMIRPQFGYTHTSSFSIEIATYENSVCNYRNANVPAGSYIPITSQPTKTHIISSYQIAPGATQDDITIICTSTGGITRERNFTLRLDPNAPVINSVTAVPNPVTIKSFNVAEGKTAYWTLLGAVVDKDAFCKYSLQSKPYAQMEYDLGKGVSEDKLTDYKQVNSRSVGFDTQGTYNIFVACKGLNSLISEPKGITVIVNENASIVPIIVSPKAGQALSSRSVNVTVNPSYQATSCTIRIANSQVVTPLTKSGSSFSGTITVPSDGTHTINATCSYPTSPFVTQGSAISYFDVDTIAPNMTKAEASDPFTRNMTVTFHRTAVRMDVGAHDATSGVSRFHYTVLVNNQNVASGSRSVTTTNNAALTFYDNTLNLKDNDVISVRVSASDFVGNNGTPRTSNNLLFTIKEYPPTCDDGIKNGNETGIDCGGDCPACPEDEGCKTDADCEGGYSCINKVCIPTEESCRDGECGGDCPACDLGGGCNSNDDCKEGLFCSKETGKCELDVKAICSNKKHDKSYESDIDCGGICALQLNLTCPAGDSCRQQTDCAAGLTCTNGICTEAKSKPAYCYTSQHNNSINTSNGTIYCGHDCDELCPVGVGCRFDVDCKSGLRCRYNVCVVPTSESDCIPSDPLSNCGGTCPTPCATGANCKDNSDCRTGLVCTNGKCANPPGTTQPPPTPTPKGGLGQPCMDDGRCDDDLRCNKDFVCEEKTGVSWVRIVLFIILIALLAAIGYYAYITYYSPKDKPDFLKTKEEREKEARQKSKAPPGFPLEPIKVDGNTHTIQPPSAPLAVQSPKVDALLDKRRKEQKKEEISKLFGAFDESALDDDEKKDGKLAKNVLKNVPKADFDDKPPVPVRAQSSEKTFKDILAEARKEVSEENNKENAKKETKKASTPKTSPKKTESPKSDSKKASETKKADDNKKKV
jgi:hypothetical protein